MPNSFVNGDKEIKSPDEVFGSSLFECFPINYPSYGIRFSVGCLSCECTNFVILLEFACLPAFVYGISCL